MLAIRMQRTGRKGHSQFRVIVQESRLAPTSGRVVARLGSHNPHTKTTALDKEKTTFYLQHGAQPSDRVVRILQAEGVKLPGWVKSASTKERTIRNPEKLRKNRPAEASEAKEPKVEESTEEAETKTESSKAEPEEKPAKDAEKPQE